MAATSRIKGLGKQTLRGWKHRRRGEKRRKRENTNRKRASEYQGQRARRKMGTWGSTGGRNIPKQRGSRVKSWEYWWSCLKGIPVEPSLFFLPSAAALCSSSKVERCCLISLLPLDEDGMLVEAPLGAKLTNFSTKAQKGTLLLRTHDIEWVRVFGRELNQIAGSLYLHKPQQHEWGFVAWGAFSVCGFFPSVYICI